MCPLLDGSSKNDVTPDHLQRVHGPCHCLGGRRPRLPAACIGIHAGKPTFPDAGGGLLAIRLPSGKNPQPGAPPFPDDDRSLPRPASASQFTASPCHGPPWLRCCRFFRGDLPQRASPPTNACKVEGDAWPRERERADQGCPGLSGSRESVAVIAKDISARCLSLHDPATYLDAGNAADEAVAAPL